MARGNKARRDAYVSIPAEVKEMLRILHPAIQHMPKIERIDGVGAEMRKAAYAILREYHIAYFCKDGKEEHVRKMVGWFGHLQAAFEVACQMGVMKDGFKLSIAMRMERIEEGVMKWNNSQSTRRQESGTGTPPNMGGGQPARDQGVKGDGASFTPA